MKQAWLHRVRPLVHRGMAEWNEKQLIPPNILKELESVHQLKSLENMDRVKELIQVVQLFETQGIDAFLTKE